CAPARSLIRRRPRPKRSASTEARSLASITARPCMPKRRSTTGLRSPIATSTPMCATRRYDLVWASHILEHQRNAGIFIDKLVELCA
ncbi:MAG: hypothetical protein AVDCRST_MAG91-945, partial [uncultured Sphingomonadaceae bacterium]